ncbi:MAG: nuclear transport factor 2 family protein [Caldimonas sp.]
MDSQRNKQTMQIVFDALAQGNGQPFVDAMSDDFAWTISGSGPWSRSWRGKDAVRRELFRPLFGQFQGTYRNRASRFVADGDIVVVECKGEVATKAGARYDNDYCYVCRFDVAGRLVALTEYMDTALAERVLTPLP